MSFVSCRHHETSALGNQITSLDYLNNSPEYKECIFITEKIILLSYGVGENRIPNTFENRVLTTMREVADSGLLSKFQIFIDKRIQMSVRPKPVWGKSLALRGGQNWILLWHHGRHEVDVKNFHVQKDGYYVLECVCSQFGGDQTQEYTDSTKLYFRKVNGKLQLHDVHARRRFPSGLTQSNTLLNKLNEVPKPNAAYDDDGKLRVAGS